MSVFVEATATHQSTYRGYNIVVVLRKRGSEHFYCGYVRLPEGHVFYGATFDDYLDINSCLKVHGLVNFFGRLDGFDGYYLGFDCNHAGDDPSVQNEEYTTRECERMIDQLIEMENLEVDKIGSGKGESVDDEQLL